jgi:hypothetical protein
MGNDHIIIHPNPNTEKSTAVRLCAHSAKSTAITKSSSPKLGGYKNRFENGICESKVAEVEKSLEN